MGINAQEDIEAEVIDLDNKVRGPNANTSVIRDLSRSNSIDEDLDAHSADLFFRFLELDQKNLNKNFGYEMWIKDVKSGKIVAKYPFPLNPQNIQINTSPATTLEATMKGVYETHNGAPFRQITISGTTGTNPIVTNPPESSMPSGLQRSVEYAFKNTIQAFNSTVNQVNRTVNAFRGATEKFEGPLNYQIIEVTKQVSGYQSIHDMARFLDYYLAGKKLSKNKSWRLQFVMHKDQILYSCSLGPYAITKSSGTTEYNYTISLTGYRREMSTSPDADFSRRNKSGINAASTANTLSNIINGLKQARQTLAIAHRVMSGIRSDINESFIKPLGETILLCKDIAGLAKTMYDFAFSGQTLKALEESWKQYFIDNKATLQGVSQSVALAIGSPSFGVHAPERAEYLDQSAQKKIDSNKPEQFQNNEDSADPVVVLFQAPADYPEIFEEFPLDNMAITPDLIDQLDAITAQVLEFTADDIIDRKETIENFALSISESLGGGSSTLNEIKGLNPVKQTFKKLSVDDVVLLAQLNDISVHMDRLIALLDQSASNDAEDHYSFYSDYAVSQGIRFNTDNLSKFFVPFPFNATLEQISAQYLGTPDRWIEIAAINGLKAPFVDEDGFDITVIASAGGDTLTVADPATLYVGEIIEVSSSVERITKRKVRSIDIVSETETIVTFETIPDSPLTIYRPSQGAKIRAFLPNTVNSNMLIAIPSSTPPKFNTTFKTSPELADLDAISRIAKVDIMLDANGDFIITGGGDIRLAAGMTNLVQAAMIKIRTNTHELLHLPSFGNPIQPGTNTADVSAQETLQSISAAFDSDPRFAGVIAGEVAISGTASNISLLVGVQDTQVTLPISTDIPRIT